MGTRTWYNPLTGRTICCDEFTMKQRLEIANAIFVRDGYITMGDYERIIDHDNNYSVMPNDNLVGFVWKGQSRVVVKNYEPFTYEQFKDCNILLFPIYDEN